MGAKKGGLKGSELCRTLDIQPYVLRYWETEFKALQSVPGTAGQRVYSDTDVALVRRIKQLLYEEGYTIAGAKKKLESEPLESQPAAAATETASLFASEATTEIAEAEEVAVTVEEPPPPVALQDASAPSLDSGSKERIKQLRRGISEALAEAQSVLKILDKHPR